MENQEKQQNKQENVEAPKTLNSNQPTGNKKLWGVLGYIFPILFFVPLVIDELKNNSYSKFHANQQLVLLLAAVAVNVFGRMIPVLGWFIILPIGTVALMVLAIIGIINAVKDKQKPLPIIGAIKIMN